MSICEYRKHIEIEVTLKGTKRLHPIVSILTIF